MDDNLILYTTGNQLLEWLKQYFFVNHKEKSIFDITDYSSHEEIDCYIFEDSIRVHHIKFTIRINNIDSVILSTRYVTGISQDYLKILLTNIKNQWAGKKILPKKPSVGAANDKWLTWYQVMKKQGDRMTLKELSVDMGLSYGYVRQLYMNYKAEFDTKDLTDT